jgi:exodeoxyribonuclease VII large subunit
VARAIADSAIPVVSAVGHEIDFTIADFVADLRAPTPSAAAELLVPDTGELLLRVARLRGQLQRSWPAVMSGARRRLEFLTRAALFREPAKRVSEAAQKLDLVVESLRRAVAVQVDAAGQRLQSLEASVRQHRPDQLLQLRRLRFEGARQRLLERVGQRLLAHRTHLERAAQVVNLLAPAAMLGRGYSMTTTLDGRIITSVKDIAPGVTLLTKVSDGSIRSTVE